MPAVCRSAQTKSLKTANVRDVFTPKGYCLFENWSLWAAGCTKRTNVNLSRGQSVVNDWVSSVSSICRWKENFSQDGGSLFWQTGEQEIAYLRNYRQKLQWSPVQRQRNRRRQQGSAAKHEKTAWSQISSEHCTPVQNSDKARQHLSLPAHLEDDRLSVCDDCSHKIDPGCILQAIGLRVDYKPRRTRA